MINIGTVSYLAGGSAFLVLGILLATSWRGRLQGGMVIAATGVSMIWCYALAYQASVAAPFTSFTYLLELFRDGAWLTLLVALDGQTTLTLCIGSKRWGVAAESASDIASRPASRVFSFLPSGCKLATTASTVAASRRVCGSSRPLAVRSAPPAFLPALPPDRPRTPEPEPG